VYAQHVPIEFERDRHYLYDSSAVDIDPVAESSGAGGGGHDHGHRRLADVDAALHTYEDACDAVGCYVESTGCEGLTGMDMDMDSLPALTDRAAKRCHMTVEEGSTCPADHHDDHDDDHHGGHDVLPACACLAADLGFEIDCGKPAPMQAAYDALVSDCLTDCSSAACKKNWAIVESHHDFCLHDQVPLEVKLAFTILRKSVSLYA
jgi:hypothetical protein